MYHGSHGHTLVASPALRMPPQPVAKTPTVGQPPGKVGPSPGALTDDVQVDGLAGAVVDLVAHGAGVPAGVAAVGGRQAQLCPGAPQPRGGG